MINLNIHGQIFIMPMSYTYYTIVVIKIVIIMVENKPERQINKC